MVVTQLISIWDSNTYQLPITLKLNTMKNIITIIIFNITLLFSMSCKAQIPNDGDNVLNNHINKFVGTWNWSLGNDSFQLILKKENVKLPFGNNIYGDKIIGFHKFINNGSIIENSTQYSSETFSYTGNSTIYGSTENNNSNILSGNITHLSKNKSIRFIIEYIDATHIKLVKLENTSGIRFKLPGKPPFDGSITIPKNIILTKQ